MPKKIILFGANGMLGKYFHVYLGTEHEVIPIIRQQYDPLQSNLLDLDNLITKLGCNPDTTIINCVGMIPQRSIVDETIETKYVRVNSEFPHLLNAISQKYKCHFIHITTDCVYDGMKGHYVESDLPTETNDYGKSKSLGEPAGCTVIRTSIIGEELENKKSLLEWVKSQNKKTINGYDNHYWNGVTCLQLAKIVDKIIKNSEYWIGIRHVFSPQSISKYELVLMIIRTYGLEIEVNRIITPKNCDKTLDTIYETNHQFSIQSLVDQIKEQCGFKLL